MFFGLTREDVTLTRFRSGLLYFLVLWLTLVVLAAGTVYSLRRQLGQSEQAAVEQLLERFLAENSTSRLQLSPFPADRQRQLSGLAFVRIDSGSDRLLLAAEEIDQHLFQELLQIGPQTTGPWLKLAGNETAESYAVASRMLAGTTVVHGGKNSHQSYLLYRNILKAAIIAVVLASVVCWYAALIAARRMVAPLAALQGELQDLIDGNTNQLLTEGQFIRECDSLYQQINHLIRQNNQLITEMQASLDNVAHDLRTPMTRLRSVAEFGLREESDIGRLRDSLTDILEESERVLAMLNIMMSVAEAETGTMRLELAPLDLCTSITEMVELYEYVAQDKRIEFITELQEQLFIKADRTRIAQVWANLMDNGIKYGREGGWLRLATAVDNDQAIITFADNGIGISESELPHIWQRLFRGDRSRSQQGLGLGLNYAAAVVEAHGGTIEVESVLHEGSRFVVTLPLLAGLNQ